MGFWDWLTVTPEAEPPSAPVGLVAPTADDIVAALASIEEQVAAQGLSGAIEYRVSRIAALVRDVLPRVDALGWGSLDAFSVMSTATDYLPDAIKSYSRLPRDWAEARPVDDGKSSLLLLVDQLDLLAATIEKISEAINHSDATELVAHGRFLQEKFGKPDSPQLSIETDHES